MVPPNQAEVMYEGLKKRGITTGLVMFKGEQHGFRGANAIRRALEVCSLACRGLLDVPGLAASAAVLGLLYKCKRWLGLFHCIQAHGHRVLVLQGELFFYGRVLGFNAAMSPDLETFEISNLHKS